jgi:hypothetical protein
MSRHQKLHEQVSICRTNDYLEMNLSDLPEIRLSQYGYIKEPTSVPKKNNTVTLIVRSIPVECQIRINDYPFKKKSQFDYIIFQRASKKMSADC